MIPVVGTPARLESWRRAIIHLRLMFSIVLTPLFVWGVYIATTTSLSWQHILAAYLVVHVLLYGSMNAFNSYYDCDEGPIGSLEAPPPVDRTVLILALICKAAALSAGLLLDVRFGFLVLVGIGFSLGYSHPRWRWKEHPLLAGLSIFAFQGVLGVLFGWTAATWPPIATDGWPLVVPPGTLNIVAVLGAACWTLGFYPLTGVYQIDGDARAGIRTLAVALGVKGCFLFAAVVAPIGGLAVVMVLLARGGYIIALCSAVYVVGASLYSWLWYRKFGTLTVVQNQRMLMRLSYCNGVVFSGLFLGLLLLP